MLRKILGLVLTLCVVQGEKQEATSYVSFKQNVDGQTSSYGGENSQGLDSSLGGSGQDNSYSGYSLGNLGGESDLSGLSLGGLSGGSGAQGLPSNSYSALGSSSISNLEGNLGGETGSSGLSLGGLSGDSGNQGLSSNLDLSGLSSSLGSLALGSSISNLEGSKSLGNFGGESGSSGLSLGGVSGDSGSQGFSSNLHLSGLGSSLGSLSLRSSLGNLEGSKTPDFSYGSYGQNFEKLNTKAPSISLGKTYDYGTLAKKHTFTSFLLSLGKALHKKTTHLPLSSGHLASFGKSYNFGQLSGQAGGLKGASLSELSLGDLGTKKYESLYDGSSFQGLGKVKLDSYIPITEAKGLSFDLGNYKDIQQYELPKYEFKYGGQF